MSSKLEEMISSTFAGVKLTAPAGDMTRAVVDSGEPLTSAFLTNDATVYVLRPAGLFVTTIGFLIDALELVPEDKRSELYSRR